MQGEDPVQWEDKIIENRKYRAINKSVVLTGVFNEPELREIIEESFESDIVKPQSSPFKLKGISSLFSLINSSYLLVETARSLLAMVNNYDPLASAAKTDVFY
jgi:hypothetical protein